MLNPTAIPRDDATKLDFIRHLNTALPAYAETLAIGTDDLTELTRAAAWFEFALDWRTTLKNASQIAVTFQQTMCEGPKSGTLSIPMPVVPKPPALPPFEDLFGFLATLISHIHSHPSYTDAIGRDLGLLPASHPVEENLRMLQPTLSVDMQQGHPKLLWKRDGMDGLEIEVDRGTGSFSLLTIHLSPGYIDTAPLPGPGTTALWRYRGIYQLRNKRVGNWSAIIEIVVTGG